MRFKMVPIGHESSVKITIMAGGCICGADSWRNKVLGSSLLRDAYLFELCWWTRYAQMRATQLAAGGMRSTG